MRWIAIVLVLSWCGVAHADLVGGAGHPANAVLIGARGEVFTRGTDGWKRRSPGGVAPLLIGVTGMPGDVWALGASTPPYHHDGTSWSAAPVAHGGAAILAGPGSTAPAFAVGRRVSVRVKEGTAMRWQETAALAGGVSALWASSATDVVAATHDAKLWRLSGTTWRAISAPKGVDEIVAIAGDKATLIALTRGGNVLRISGNRATAVEPFPARLAAVAGGHVFLAGDSQLVEVVHDKIVPVADLALPDAPVALLAGDDGSILLATARGAIWRREAKSTDWITEAIDGTLPADRPGAAPALAH